MSIDEDNWNISCYGHPLWKADDVDRYSGKVISMECFAWPFQTNIAFNTIQIPTKRGRSTDEINCIRKCTFKSYLFLLTALNVHDTFQKPIGGFFPNPVQIVKYI